MWQDVLWPFWEFICTRKIVRNKNVLISQYARLFVTPFQGKLANFFMTTYFSTTQTIWFWPSESARQDFLTILGHPMHQENYQVQKCYNFSQHTTISHIVRRKTREFFKMTYFSTVQTIFFWPFLVRATIIFLPFWDFHCIRKIFRYKNVIIFH